MGETRRCSLRVIRKKRRRLDNGVVERCPFVRGRFSCMAMIIEKGYAKNGKDS